MIHFKDNGCPNWENGDITTGLLWDEYIEVARNDRNYCGLCIKHNTGSFYMRFLLFVNNVAPFLVALLIVAVFAYPIVLDVMIRRAQKEFIKECQTRKCTTGSPTWMEGKCLCMILPE